MSVFRRSPPPSGLHDRSAHLGESGLEIAHNMDSEQSPASPFERPEVTQGLGPFHYAEAEGLTRDGDIQRIVRRELNKKPVAPSALVKLPRRVEESGAIAQGRRDPEAIADPGADRVEDPLRRPRAREIRGQRHVIAGAGPQEMCPKGRAKAPLPLEDRSRRVVSVELHRAAPA